MIKAKDIVTPVTKTVTKLAWNKASPAEKNRRALEAMAEPGCSAANLMISEMAREAKLPSVGRPRKHASKAAKQKAYRERKRAQ